MNKRTVTIIGAGMVGASIAYKLSKHVELSVRIIDSTSPSTQASAASMAWLNASNKRPRDYFDLNFAGMKEYQVLRSELKADWYHPTGTLAVDGYAANILEKVAELESWGYAVERTTTAQAYAEHLPQATVTDPGEFVAHYPDEGWIDTVGATGELLAAAAADSVTFEQGTAVGRIDKENSGYRITLADGTSFTTDVIVNAAGAKADRIAALIGRRLPLAPTKGLTLRLQAPEVEMNKIVLTGTVEIRPDVDGSVRVHSEGVDGLMAQGAATDRDELIQVLHERATALIPELGDAQIAQVFMANRPIPEDNFSCIGPVSGFENYYEAVTHSGVTIGPLVGRLIEQFVVSDTKDELLTSRFSPDRFSED